MRRRVLRAAISIALLVLGTAVIPHRWCGREGARWYAGDVALQTELGRGLARWVRGPLSTAAFHTGSASFDGEWLFGTYLMAALGFGQSALEHPELRAEHLTLMGECIDRLLTREVRAFDRDRWGDDPIDALDRPNHPSDHTSYLGYLNLALGLHRQLDPASRFAPLHDRITAHFVARYRASRIQLLETYPGERYPVDNAAAIASLAQHARLTGADHGAIVATWTAYVRAHYLDAKTGLLMQSVTPDGAGLDAPRGSGTALAAYFLSFANDRLSQDLHESLARHLQGRLLGFGVVREYPPSQAGRGDIDSGPIVFGYGVSATGFALAASRIHRDPQTYASLYATAYLFGAPYTSDARREFITGGPIGNAILFAMLTAQPRHGSGSGSEVTP